MLYVSCGGFSLEKARDSKAAIEGLQLQNVQSKPLAATKALTHMCLVAVNVCEGPTCIKTTSKQRRASLQVVRGVTLQSR